MVDLWKERKEEYIELYGQYNWNKTFENPTEPYIDKYESDEENNSSSDDYDTDDYDSV